MTNTREMSGQADVRWMAVCVGMVIIMIFTAVSTRSLWIDEAWTAHFARMRGIREWWSSLLMVPETNLQMPLYSLWIWAMEKGVGSSEFALRFANCFWFVPALYIAVRAFAGRPVAAALLVAVSASAFTWYYLDEARSYIMQLSTALVVHSAAARLVSGPFPDCRAERRWVLVFAAGLALLCGSSLLAMYLAIIPMLGIAVLLSRARIMELLRSHWVIWLPLAFVLAAWGGFYLWTLQLGARATTIAGTDWRNPLYVAYELSGFSGLGPGRAQIRDGGLGVFKPFAAILAAYAGLLGVLAMAALAHLRSWGWRRMLVIAAVALGPVALLFLASHLKQFRILGRHFAALAPAVFLFTACGMGVLWRRGWAGRLAVAAFVLLGLASGLSLRFADRHAKDDYRGVARLASDALSGGGRVWWNADEKAAAYYRVPLAGAEANRTGALFVMNPAPASLVSEPAPDLVICSRPEVYDGTGAVAAYLQGNGYRETARFPGFVIWRPAVAKVAPL